MKPWSLSTVRFIVSLLQGSLLWLVVMSVIVNVFRFPEVPGWGLTGAALATFGLATWLDVYCRRLPKLLDVRITRTENELRIETFAVGTEGFTPDEMDHVVREAEKHARGEEDAAASGVSGPN